MFIIIKLICYHILIYSCQLCQPFLATLIPDATHFQWIIIWVRTGDLSHLTQPGSAFIKPDQRNPWIKDQIKITLLPTISHLLLPNFFVMWEGLSLPHDTKFGNCRCKIVDSRSFHSWSLIHGLRWSGLIKVGPGLLKDMGSFDSTAV